LYESDSDIPFKVLFGEAIPIRGGELIAISVLKVLEFFLNCHATIHYLSVYLTLRLFSFMWGNLGA
jgi:hypothetical protein